MKASSQDLRERVLRAVDRGYPRTEIVQFFGISLSTLKRYLKQQREKGGNLTEGLTVFELKDGNVMRRVGIGVGHRSLAAPDAASSSNSLYIGPLMPA